MPTNCAESYKTAGTPGHPTVGHDV